MAKKAKRKLTAAEKAAKARRPEVIEGQSAEDFMTSNADPMWLLQNEMWEYLQKAEKSGNDSIPAESDDIPFQCL